jgi:hypothetical protein
VDISACRLGEGRVISGFVALGLWPEPKRARGVELTYGRHPATAAERNVWRDFSDVSPVDGIIVGSRKQKLRVEVDVIPVE